jgi:hypothetical protein
VVLAHSAASESATEESGWQQEPPSPSHGPPVYLHRGHPMTPGLTRRNLPRSATVTASHAAVTGTAEAGCASACRRGRSEESPSGFSIGTLKAPALVCQYAQRLRVRVGVVSVASASLPFCLQSPVSIA